MVPVQKFDLSLLPEMPDLRFEKELWAQGLKYIGGIDEAGRGALAGPVYAATVILPFSDEIANYLSGVNDSKQMTPEAREYWAIRIKKYALGYGIGFASNLEIDEFGIVTAVRLAIQRSIGRLCIPPQHLLVDFLDIPNLHIPKTLLVKGDARSLSIAAASVLAKTARDEVMCLLDRQFPDYLLAENKGYGTQAHRDRIRTLGRCPIHRSTYRIDEDS